MNPLFIDNSMIQSFAICEMQAWLRYMMHRNTAQGKATLMAGHATAVCLASFRRDWKIPEALAVFDRDYKDWALHNVERDDAREWHNCRNILHQYMLANGPDQQTRFQVIPELIEVTFELPLTKEGDIIYIGRIDLIPVWETGDYVVLDDKTTGDNLSTYWANKWKTDSGGSGYVWALRQKGYTVQGLIINAIQFRKLPDDPHKTCSRHKVKFVECGIRHARWELFGPYPREDGYLEQWRQDTVWLARQFLEYRERYPELTDAPFLPMRGQYNTGCKNCDFPEYCLSGRNPALMNANLVYEVWDPRKPIQEASHAQTQTSTANPKSRTTIAAAR